MPPETAVENPLESTRVLDPEVYQPMVDDAFIGKQETKPEAEAKGEKEGESPAPEVKSTDPTVLQGQVAGLEKELARVRPEKNEVRDLREQLAKMEGKIEAQDKQTGGQPKTSEQLTELQGSWEDELIASKISFGVANGSGDTEAAQSASQREAKAKEQVRLIKAELKVRAEKNVVIQQEEAQVQQVATTQITDMVAKVMEMYPGMDQPGNPIWEAGNKVWKDNEAVMKPLGALGEILAVGTAIALDPSLVSGKPVTKEDKTVRKDLIKNIEKATESSLFKGGSTSTQKGPLDYMKMLEQPGGLERFNKLVNEITGAG